VRKYVNKAMGELAAELTAGLLRLRKGYVDAAEALLQIIKPGRQYPYEFAVYRITGYRGERIRPASEPLDGEELARDLQTLMLDLCDSFALRTEDYPEPCYDSDSLARRFNVSAKTIQRWRSRGLPARRLIFPDGKRRIAFLASSVQWFVSRQGKQIVRSRKFTQLSRSEREEVVRRAKRLAGRGGARPGEVVRRLAARVGRAAETIRYTIRKHDLEHPEDAVFPYVTAPLGDQEKMLIYRSFLRGVAVPELSQRFHRTRGSIYRIVNEIRARRLMDRRINYIHNPEFDEPGADQAILAQADRSDRPHRAKAKVAADLPPYLRSLYEVPLLDAETERDLFRRYNYLKCKADRLRRQIDLGHVRTGLLREIEKLLLQANVIKNRIIRANLRLVVSIAKKHVSGAQTLFELVSDGNVSLMQAVEKFDYSRGYRFSTYASWAIMRNFARSVPRERYRMDRFATGNDEVLNIAASLRTYDPNEINISELRESIDALLAQLRPRERAILMDHFGLDRDGKTKTLNQLGKELGLSKERVRQIEIQALRKLRDIIRPQEADFLS